MLGIERSSAWVYGCFGSWKMSSTGPCSTTRPEVHHHHVVGHLGDHAQVVGDQHDRHAVLAAAARAAGRGSAPGWSRRARSSARRRSAGAGRRRAPSRSSRAGAGRRSAGTEYSSIAPLRARNADHAQQLDRRGRAPPSWSASVCSADRLDDLVADGVHRAERGHRLLEDQRDLAAADRAHLAAVGGRARPGRSCVAVRRASRQDLAADDAARAVDDAQDRLGGDALAAAALADDAERLAGADVEADAVDGA